MAKQKDVVAQPVCNGGIEFIELASEEVIDSFHDDQVIFARKGCNKSLDVLDRAELVVAAVDKKFRFAALVQKRKIRVVDRKTHPNHVRDSRILAADAQT